MALGKALGLRKSTAILASDCALPASSRNSPLANQKGAEKPIVTVATTSSIGFRRYCSVASLSPAQGTGVTA